MRRRLGVDVVLEEEKEIGETKKERGFLFTFHPEIENMDKEIQIPGCYLVDTLALLVGCLR